jgi:hypothetical protein
MRILGSIPHPQFKISVFSWSEKYLVKVEAGFFEQTYKFREADFQNWEELIHFFDTEMMQQVLATFKKMAADAMEAAKRMQQNNLEK